MHDGLHQKEAFVAQQERARATRATVIEGAARTFETVGYGNASLADIAEAASVTKGALYFHFKSKEDLAKAVIAEQHSRVRATSEPILGGGHTPLTTMVLLCRHFAEQLIADSVIRAGIRLTLEASAFGGSVKDPYEDWVSTMQQLASQGQYQGEINPDVEAEVLARFVVAAFTGVQLVSDVLTARTDLLKRVDDMWMILLPVLASASETRTSLAEIIGTNP